MGSGAGLAAVILPVILAWFHPDSLSSSRVEVRGNSAHVIVRCPLMSLLEVIDGLDVDDDGIVTPAETEAAGAAILEYVGAHYGIRTGTNRDLDGGRTLAPVGLSVRAVTAGSTDVFIQRGGAVDVELRFDDDAPIRDVLVEVTLFRTTSPDHVDLTTVDWGDDGIDTFGLDAAEPRGRSDPTGHGAFAAFFALGFRHILGGWDHLAFLGALILATRRLGSLLAVITAFTVAHSITLALAALGVVDLSRWTGLIELGIALSIVFVAFDSILAVKLERPRWIEALVFGLLHGLGFASFLGQSLVHEQTRWIPLAAFNVGVEVGQVLAALLAVGLLRALPRRDKEDNGLAPRSVRLVGAAAIGMLGLWWALQRI